MNVKDLITMLENKNPDAIVKMEACDEDIGFWTVAGCTYNKHEVVLYADAFIT